MAFLCGDQIDKQYLNLSSFAYDTIQNDILAFGDSGMSSFVNRVFSNFYPDANASISLTLQRKRDEWERVLASLPNRDDAVSRLLKAEKDRLVTIANGYPKGHSIKIRLNNKNYNYLTDFYGICAEEKYYRRGNSDSAGLYIKAVLEEYTRKSFLEREAIFFRERLESISDAISQKIQLKITVQSGMQYYVRPYCVATDKQSAYHYLIGLSYRAGRDESEAAPFSFRISRIQDIALCRSRSGFISSTVKAELVRLIAEKGAAFIGGNTTTIRVRLSKQGEYMYQNILHLRPAYIACEEGDDSVYTFECTPQQIRFYFIQFGKHAQILYPPALAEEFRQFFRDAIGNE